MTRIAFIGLGNMGAGMCANLARAGHQVRAFDLSKDAVANAESSGAKGAASVAEAVSDAQVVVSMLPAGKHVLSVYFGPDGVAAHAPKDTLFLDCSTIAVEDAREAARQAEAAGFSMVDAPVSGGTAGAEAGTLTFMCGGPDDGFARAKPLLEKMGKNIFHAVPTSPANRDYKPGFAVAMMLKDLHLAAEAAKASGADIRLGEMAETIYAKLDEKGFGGLDFSGVIKDVRGEL